MLFGASRNNGRPGPSDDGLVAAFDIQARRFRHRILILSPTWRVTVGHIDDWSRDAADRVLAARLAPGSVVGLAAPSGPAFLAGFLALRRAGCTSLLLDDTAANEDRARVVSTIGPCAILHCQVDADARAFHARLETVGQSDTFKDPARAVILMTSGSTGQARGVAVTTESLLADENALAHTMGLRADDRVVAALPMSHRYGFTTLALSALVRGLQLVVPAAAGPLAPISAADLCEATVFPTVPAYLEAVLRISQPPAWPASVRVFLTAGGPLPPATAAQFREAAGRPVHVFYGASEAGGICYDRVGDAGERGTVGTPVEGVSISLTPADDPRGGGRLAVRSPSVGATYVPTSDPGLRDGCFQTADLAVWRGGEIELLRRVDRVINVRGFKVDPAEVEQVLSALSGVDEVAVTGAPGPGGHGTIVRAVIACRTGVLDAAAVTAWCRARLAEHKVPRSVVLVPELPRTSRGKIDVTALDNA